MKIDGKAMLKKLADAKGDRKKVSLYLSKSLYEAFKESCGEKVSASETMEELMRTFIESLKKK